MTTEPKAGRRPARQHLGPVKGAAPGAAYEIRDATMAMQAEAKTRVWRQAQWVSTPSCRDEEQVLDQLVGQKATTSEGPFDRETQEDLKTNLDWIMWAILALVILVPVYLLLATI